MKCEVCGQEYGLAHNCPGVAPSITEEEAAPPPDGFAPLYYLRLGFKILCWDDVSIRRASHDAKAVFYGAFFWAVSATATLLIAMLPRIPTNKQVPVPVQAFALLVGLAFALVLMGIIAFIQYGLSHLIAKWFFGATGTLVGVIRPLLLAWGFVNALTLIPVAGLLVGGIAGAAVVMLVFEEVDGIRRMQAFLVAWGIGICIFVLEIAMQTRH